MFSRGESARILAAMCSTGIGWFFKHSALYNLDKGEECLSKAKAKPKALLKEM